MITREKAEEEEGKRMNDTYFFNWGFLFLNFTLKGLRPLTLYFHFLGLNVLHSISLHPGTHDVMTD